jgi:hypothetical protein
MIVTVITIITVMFITLILASRTPAENSKRAMRRFGEMQPIAASASAAGR